MTVAELRNLLADFDDNALVSFFTHSLPDSRDLVFYEVDRIPFEDEVVFHFDVEEFFDK